MPRLGGRRETRLRLASGTACPIRAAGESPARDDGENALPRSRREAGHAQAHRTRSGASPAEVLESAERALDNKDRYDRLLRYVHKGKKNVNVVLVRRGAATVWFFQGDRGAYAKRLLRRSEEAQNAGRGLWGACPGTPFNPEQAATTGLADQPAPASGPAPKPEPADGASEPVASGNCDPSYPDFCIPSPPPDLDCADVSGPFAVVGADPHRFDGDDDEVGCESG